MHNNLTIEENWLNLKRNCDYYFSRIIDYPLCPPEHVYFCLTSRCNLKCKMCTVWHSPNREEDELNIEESKKIIDQIADLKINHLIFSGGEPLLRKDIFDLIAYAIDKKIKMVDVITNGLLIDERVAQKLVNLNLNHVTISIDGLEETNDFIRGKGSFKKALEAIDLIKKYKNNKFPTVGINFTIIDYNIDQILPMIDLAKIKGCHIIVLQPMLPDNANMKQRNKHELWVCEENILKLREVITEVIELKKTIQNLSIHVNEKILEMIPSYFAGLPLDRNLKCYEAIVRIVISYNGYLWACRGIYGNLRKSSLRNCWFSPQAKKIRQEIKQCRSHCLQSCVHLAELSDIYTETREFKNSIDKVKENEEYIKGLLVLFKNYNLLLTKKLIKCLRTESGRDKNNYLNELKSEITKTSEIIKGLTYHI